jgi:predicted RNA methylase
MNAQAPTNDDQLDFETFSPVKRVVKRVFINPLANYAPAGMLRWLLRAGDSELAKANWNDPGGWRSMVISYEGNPEKIADRILVSGGTIPTALRNRRKLAAAITADLLDASDSDPAHLLCLGAGPGIVATDVLLRSARQARATLVDLSADAFDYGRSRAEQMGLGNDVRFIQADVRDVERFLDAAPNVVMMFGICEYLDDEHIVSIASAAAKLMPPGRPIVFNSISPAHGTDRFFRRVFGLHMNHRTPAQLQALMASAGFGSFHATPEPLGVYHVITGVRQDDPAGDEAMGGPC